MKKFITLTILASLLLTSISCGGTETQPDLPTSEESTSAEPESTVPEETTLSDDLADENFGGYKFRILSSIQGQATLTAFPAEETGDTMNDAYYKRNRKVAERFNVEFVESTDGKGMDISIISKNVRADDDAYDLYQIWDRIAISAAQKGFIYSIDNLPDINLSKPYWGAFNDSLTINGKQWYVTGDENPVLLTGLMALFFSKDMADDLGIGRDTFYNDVRQGKWTIDKFFGYAKQAMRDTNGDGEVDEGDIFGIAMTNNSFFVDFFTNSGARFIDKDKDDVPYLSVVGNTRYLDIYDKVMSHAYSDERMLFNTANTPLSKDEGKDSLSQTLMILGSGHSLFAGTSMSRARTLRSYELDFGIVPFPTLDEKEPGTAYSGRTDSLVPYVVPKTNSDLHRTGVLLEALACEGHNSVLPTYYNVVLGQKETRDEDSIEMLNMMFSNRCVELESILYATRTIESAMGKKKENLSSKIASIQSNFESKISKLLKELE